MTQKTIRVNDPSKPRGKRKVKEMGEDEGSIVGHRDIDWYRQNAVNEMNRNIEESR